MTVLIWSKIATRRRIIVLKPMRKRDELVLLGEQTVGGFEVMLP